MQKDEFGFWDEFSWKVKAAFGTSGGAVILVLILVFFGAAAYALKFFNLWQAFVSILAVLGLWLVLPDWIGRLSLRWIRAKKVPTEKSFSLKSFALKAGVVFTLGAAILWFVGQNTILYVWVIAMVVFCVIVLQTFCFETVFGKRRINTVGGRLDAVSEITAEGLIISRDGQRLRMVAVIGNLGGVREPREPAVIYTAFLRIIELLAKAKNGLGSAFSVIEFANQAPDQTGDSAKSSSKFVAALTRQFKKLAPATKQQIVLLVVEDSQFAVLKQAFESQVEMELCPLSHDEVWAYLRQGLAGEEFLGTLSAGTARDYRRFLPASLAYKSEVGFSKGRAIGLMQVRPTKLGDLATLQRAVLNGAGQLQITVIPKAHPYDEFFLHADATYSLTGDSGARAKKLLARTFKDNQGHEVLVGLVVTVMVAGENVAACQKKMQAIAKAVSSKMDVRFLQDDRLARAFEDFAFWPVLPLRRIEGLWESLPFSQTATKFGQRRLFEALSVQQTSSRILAPYFGEVRNEAPSDEFLRQAEELSIQIGLGTKGTSAHRPLYLPFGDALNDPLAIFVLGALGSGKSAAIRSWMLRSTGLIPWMVLNLKPGDPYWKWVVKAADGLIVEDPLLIGGTETAQALAFREEVRRLLKEAYNKNLSFLYQAGSTISPANELGLRIVLEEISKLQTTQLTAQSQKVSILAVDEAHSLTALWESLGENARISAELMKNLLKFGREWKMVNLLILQTLGDVIGAGKPENILARTILDEWLFWGKSAVMAIFTGGATIEQLTYLGYPGGMQKSAGIDNLVHFVMDNSQDVIGRFAFIWKNAGPHFLVDTVLTAEEINLMPKRLRPRQKDRRMIGQK